MTRKSTLIEWAAALGAELPANPTTAQLEQAIEAAISKPAAPSHTLRDGIASNWAVIKAEALPTLSAVGRNLFSRSARTLA